MSGHKLLQYRTNLYRLIKDRKNASQSGKYAMKHSLGYYLAKCGVYKRKLRACMDQVERELYGRTRKEIKDQDVIQLANRPTYVWFNVLTIGGKLTNF